MGERNSGYLPIHDDLLRESAGAVADALYRVERQREALASAVEGVNGGAHEPVSSDKSKTEQPAPGATILIPYDEGASGVVVDPGYLDGGSMSERYGITPIGTPLPDDSALVSKGGPIPSIHDTQR